MGCAHFRPGSSVRARTRTPAVVGMGKNPESQPSAAWVSPERESAAPYKMRDCFHFSTLVY